MSRVFLGVAQPTALSWCQSDMAVRLCDTLVVVLTLLLAAWPVATCWPFSEFVVFCCCYTHQPCLETRRDPRQVCQPGSGVAQKGNCCRLSACLHETADRHGPWVVDAAEWQLCSGCFAVLMGILVDAKAVFCPAATLNVAAPSVPTCVHPAATRLVDVCCHCVSRLVVLLCVTTLRPSSRLSRPLVRFQA